MIRDLGRALSEAISDSSDAVRTLHQIHEEGYSLYLLLETGNGEEPAEQLPIISRQYAAKEPCFQINGHDLSFLREIGIDPTRRPRRRRNG